MKPRYRAWDKEENRWINIASLVFDEEGELWYLSPVMDDFNPVYYENELGKTWEIMQSTGLLNCETEDGKNVEGWEGDIADIGWSEQNGEFNSHRIILKSPFDYSTDEARWLIHAEYIIIRGNIYENPELLEQANEN